MQRDTKFNKDWLKSKDALGLLEEEEKKRKRRRRLKRLRELIRGPGSICTSSWLHSTTGNGTDS